MADTEGRASGLHCFRVPRQQRAHLAALLVGFALFAAPLHAQIDFDPEITQEEFRKFSVVVAQAIYPSPLQPGGASGLLRFDLGIAGTAVQIDEDDDFWQDSIGEDITISDYVGVPRLIFVKGLGAATVSASYAKISDLDDIAVWGGSLDVPIINGGVVSPTLALRGTYAVITGIEDVYDLKTYGVELILGKGFGPVTPYGGIGRMRSDARGIIPETSQTPEIVLEDQSDLTRYTLGVRLSLGIVKLVAEAAQADERAYSAKLSLGF